MGQCVGHVCLKRTCLKNDCADLPMKQKEFVERKDMILEITQQMNQTINERPLPKMAFQVLSFLLEFPPAFCHPPSGDTSRSNQRRSPKLLRQYLHAHAIFTPISGDELFMPQPEGNSTCVPKPSLHTPEGHCLDSLSSLPHSSLSLSAGIISSPSNDLTQE